MFLFEKLAFCFFWNSSQFLEKMVKKYPKLMRVDKDWFGKLLNEFMSLFNLIFFSPIFFKMMFIVLDARNAAFFCGSVEIFATWVPSPLYRAYPPPLSPPFFSSSPPLVYSAPSPPPEHCQFFFSSGRAFWGGSDEKLCRMWLGRGNAVARTPPLLYYTIKCNIVNSYKSGLLLWNRTNMIILKVIL